MREPPSPPAKVAPSPLQLEMARIAKYVTYGVTGLTLIVLVITVQSALPITAALLFAVGFACSLIPQGLPAEVNTAFGSTHVICTDKTGTLTKNEMTVTELVVAPSTDAPTWPIFGDPTEGALLVVAVKPCDVRTRTTISHASEARLNQPTGAAWPSRS